MGAQPCIMQLGFDDLHGSYDAWSTSFIKYEGSRFLTNDGGPGPTYNDITNGYIYMWDAAIGEFTEFGYPFTMWEFDFTNPSYGTFSIVPGKYDQHGDLMPCDIEAEGSGPCLEPARPWEIGLSTRDWFVSFIDPEMNRWIAPYGSSLTAQCSVRTTAFGEPFPYLVPMELKGEARAHNNVKPPSFHVPDPLPHESAEFSLKLSDESGFGWWNTLKFHPNQYVLDDGKKILHRGTLVDKAEVTETFRLKDGTYYLRMLGNRDNEAFDDMWSFSNKDGVIAFGGRHDRLTFTVSNGQVTSTITENVLDILIGPDAAPHPLADFDGLISGATLKAMKENIVAHVSQSSVLKSVGLLHDAPVAQISTPTLTESASTHPFEAAGIALSAALIGMVVMYGVMSFFKPSASYTPVMDVSSTPTSKKGPVEIQLEKSKKVMHECQI